MASENLQVPDRRYFLSIFRSKTTELESEIQRLRRETKSLVEENQQYSTLSKTVKDLRDELEDYNMARMNQFCDVTELKREIDDLHAHNQQLESTMEELYLEQRRKEERFQDLQGKHQISTLETQLNRIRDQASGSPILQEALSLIDQITELESKHDQLTTEMEGDDQEFEQCLNEIQNVQKTNLSLLTFISQTLTTANFPQLQTGLDQNENTLALLVEQHRKVIQELNKLETLDQRLIGELRELKNQSTKLQQDVAKYNDLEGLKHQAERRKRQLTIDKLNMSERRHITQIEIQTLQSQFETLRTQLQDNPTHQQLVNLEEKLQTVSRIYSPLEENPTEYEPIKHQALALVYAHNRWLIQRLKPAS